MVGKSHPNIYEIIDVFKKEEVSTKMKMQMLEAATQQATRRRRPDKVKGEENPELVCPIQFWSNVS